MFVRIVLVALLAGGLLLLAAPRVSASRARRGIVGRADRLVLENRLTFNSLAFAFAVIALLDWLLVRG